MQTLQPHTHFLRMWQMAHRAHMSTPMRNNERPAPKPSNTPNTVSPAEQPELEPPSAIPLHVSHRRRVEWTLVSPGRVLVWHLATCMAMADQGRAVDILIFFTIILPPSQAVRVRVRRVVSSVMALRRGVNSEEESTAFPPHMVHTHKKVATPSMRGEMEVHPREVVTD